MYHVRRVWSIWKRVQSGIQLLRATLIERERDIEDVWLTGRPESDIQDTCVCGGHILKGFKAHSV